MTFVPSVTCAGNIAQTPGPVATSGQRTVDPRYRPVSPPTTFPPSPQRTASLKAHSSSPLQHPRQQPIEEEHLRQRHLRDQDVVPELVGALAGAAEDVEKHPVAIATQGLEDLVLVHAVDAAIEAETGLLGVGEKQLVLTIGIEEVEPGLQVVDGGRAVYGG